MPSRPGLIEADFAPVADAREIVDASHAPCPASLTEVLGELPVTERMPALFLGHGSPMNALEDNVFTRSLHELAVAIPRPHAVLVVSAHWLTPGEVRVLCSDEPRTIHDFYGFPRELYDIRYPAPGAPQVAAAVSLLAGAERDAAWGLDHASWTLLRHMYPEADVPVLELSLDVAAPPREHLGVAAALAPLRERGVLILGSGNLVHNLGAIDWSGRTSAWEWAREFDEWAAARILAGDTEALADYHDLGETARLAVPTNDHYLPLLYAMGVRDSGERITFPYEGLEMGSLSMRCVRIG